MTTETLFVNAFDATQQNWNTHTGASPYLQDGDAEFISAFTQNVVDRNFGFADTAIADFTYISSVILELYEKDSSDLAGFKAELSINAGVSWFTAISAGGFYGDNTYRWVPSANLLAQFSSLANINDCIMRLTKLGSSSYTVSISRGKLTITWAIPSAGIQKYTIINEYDY